MKVKRLRNIWILLLVGIFFLGIGEVKASSLETVSIDAVFLRGVTQEFVTLLNQERSMLNLPEVQLDGMLIEAAEHRAGQASIYYEHRTPTDGDIWKLPVIGKNVGGEILAYISVGDQLEAKKIAHQLFDGWKASAGHYRIMTREMYKKMGLGVCYVKDNSGNKVVYASGLFSHISDSNPLVEYTQGKENITKAVSFEISSKNLVFEKDREISIGVGERRVIYPQIVNVGSRIYGLGVLSQASGTWISSNPTIVSVDENGNIQGKQAGEVFLSFHLNQSEKVYQILVEVKEGKSGFIQENGTWWYYINGARQMGWQQIGEKIYYFERYHNTGMVKGKYWIEGKYYYFHETEGYLLGTEPEAPDLHPQKEKPQAVKVTVIGKTRNTVSLRWEKSATGEGYTVYQRAEGEKTYNRVKILNGKDRTVYQVVGLKPGTKYYFVVKAWVKDGSYLFSDPSKTVRGTTKPETAVIKRVKATPDQKVKVWLKEASAGADKYAICYSRKPDFSKFKVGIRTAYTVRTVNEKLSPGIYYVKVRSYVDLGRSKVYGDWSKAVKVVVG